MNIIPSQTGIYHAEIWKMMGGFSVCYVSLPFEGHTFRAAAAVPISPASSLGGSLLPFLRRPAVWGMGELEKVGTGCLNFKSRILGQVCNSVQHPHRRGDSEIQTPPCSASIFVRRFSWLKQIWWLAFRAWSCFFGWLRILPWDSSPWKTTIWEKFVFQASETNPGLEWCRISIYIINLSMLSGG